MRVRIEADSFTYKIKMHNKDGLMRKHTTDNVLKKTFEHLDKILEEKKREANKRKEGQQTLSRASENNNKNKRELTRVSGK